MADLRSLVRDEMERAGSPSYSFDDLYRRRDRKRRNRRIAAGVVGIAVFVAAVWIVTNFGSLDRSQTSVVPGPAETGPAETAPPPAPVTPRWVFGQRALPCSDGARSILKLWVDARIRVRFEVHRSPVGHEWRIAAVPPGRDPQPVQEFGSWTADLERMAEWLTACGIEMVVMQSTGVYSALSSALIGRVQVPPALG